MKRYARFVMTMLVVLVTSAFASSMVNAMPFTCVGCPPPPVPVIVQVMAYVPVNYEQSVSFNDSDLGVILYKVQDGDSIKMDVYGLTNKGTTSTYLFSITPADLAPYAGQHPAKATLLASQGGVSVYVLTTGEIQINAGPDSEGKMHVKILDGIPWTKVYGYTIDAQ